MFSFCVSVVYLSARRPSDWSDPLHVLRWSLPHGMNRLMVHLIVLKYAILLVHYSRACQIRIWKQTNDSMSRWLSFPSCHNNQKWKSCQARDWIISIFTGKFGKSSWRWLPLSEPSIAKLSINFKHKSTKLDSALQISVQRHVNVLLPENEMKIAISHNETCLQYLQQI